MKIALDYDDTFTRDPDLWLSFIYKANAKGHDIRIVTFRSAEGDNSDIKSQLENVLPILYTGGKRKRLYCYEQGFMVNVWIDDMPEIIVEDYSNDFIPQGLINKALEEN